jgi:aryl-alcohol dehydrogenase-like predicted oxidoreductase
VSAKPSRLGLGTYLGDCTDEFSQKIQFVLLHAVKKLNLSSVDTAINYRCQRSERCMGQLIQSGKLDRTNLFLASKGGFIPFELNCPSNVSEAVLNSYQVPLKLSSEDIHDNMHCIHPRFIEWSFNQSLKNLCTDFLDVYYIHNPEFALEFMTRGSWATQLLGCFEFLQSQVKQGKLAGYGIATWHGLRLAPASPNFISLEELYLKAQEKGLIHFNSLQLPVNAYHREFLELKNQRLGTQQVTVRDWALERRFRVFSSAPLLQGQLLKHGQEVLKKNEWNEELTPSQNLLVWVLKQSGIASTLLGTSSIYHLTEAARLVDPYLGSTPYRKSG